MKEIVIFSKKNKGYLTQVTGYPMFVDDIELATRLKDTIMCRFLIHLMLRKVRIVKVPKFVVWYKAFNKYRVVNNLWTSDIKKATRFVDTEENRTTILIQSILIIEFIKVKS